MKTFLILVGACLLQFVSSQINCPQGWTRWVDEKCYSLQAEYLSFEAARAVCATKGGHLAKIKVEAQQTFLNNLIHNVSGIEDEVWLGATRVSKTEFKWEDGTSVGYANWVPSSPTEIDGRDCVVMQSRISKLSDSEGKWRDASCTRPSIFVCEKEPIWSPEEMQKVFVETRRKLDNLLANPVPIGFIYTQLPEQPIPSSLWPNIRWTEISWKFAGKFFRVVGGAAAPFETTQNADSPRLTSATHYQRQDGIRETGTNETMTITPGTRSGNLYIARHHNGDMTNHINFMVSDSDVRPINTAMRIWVRES